MNSSTPVNHFTLKPSDLSAIRLLAKNKEPKYTNHATEQTLVRDIFIVKSEKYCPVVQIKLLRFNLSQILPVKSTLIRVR